MPLVVRSSRWWFTGTALCFPLVIATDAAACGCFAPPIPSPDVQGNFAVNQRAEQIIFEVSPGMVSAHVRILYEGDPEQFAWLLPVPNIPDLELSHTELFAYVDQQTAPIVNYTRVSACPEQRYSCRQHPPCPSPYPQPQPGAVPSGAPAAAGDNLFEGAGGQSGASAPPVTVLASARVGAYDTITFAADEATLAIDWLNDNGFIVNETMSPYMQPYLDSEMVFVASKLVPGADLDELRPLRITYEANMPSIPLRLTAIAAEPHMMVTAFIYAEEEFDPIVAPIVDLPAGELSRNVRGNYPMLLARAVDEMGGFAFVKEYVGPGPRFIDATGCCTSTGGARQELPPVSTDAGTNAAAPDAGTRPGDASAPVEAGSTEPMTPLPPVFDPADVCGVGNDGQCQCPGSSFDAVDCGEDLVAAFGLADRLADEYPVLTRLTTRVSPEEMIEDPLFEPSSAPQGNVRARFTGVDTTLASCAEQVVDEERYDEIVQSQACADTYCDWGECVITDQGPGCRCDEGFLARVFPDAEGQLSLTCVPETPRVDFAAGGLELASSCSYDPAGDGECFDLGGFPAVACPSDQGAVIGVPSSRGPTIASCSEIVLHTSTQGATNYSSALADLDVCAPPPPSCPANGWLEERQVQNPGIECGEAPDPSWFDPPPAPECPDPTNAPTGTSAPTPGAAPTNPVAVAPVPILDTREPRPGADAVDDQSETARAAPSSGSSGCTLTLGTRHTGTGALAALAMGLVALLRRQSRRASRPRALPLG